MSHIDPLRPWIGHETVFRDPSTLLDGRVTGSGERTYTGPMRPADFAALGEDWGTTGAILPTLEEQQLARMFATRGDQAGYGQLQFGALGQSGSAIRQKGHPQVLRHGGSGARVVAPPPPATPVVQPDPTANLEAPFSVDGEDLTNEQWTRTNKKASVGGSGRGPGSKIIVLENNKGRNVEASESSHLNAQIKFAEKTQAKAIAEAVPWTGSVDQKGIGQRNYWSVDQGEEEGYDAFGYGTGGLPGQGFDAGAAASAFRQFGDATPGQVARSAGFVDPNMGLVADPRFTEWKPPVESASTAAPAAATVDPASQGMLYNLGGGLHQLPGSVVTPAPGTVTPFQAAPASAEFAALQARQELGTEPGAEVIAKVGGTDGEGVITEDPDAADRVLWNSYKAAGGGLSFLNWRSAGKPTGPPDDEKVTTTDDTTTDDTTTEGGRQQQATGQPQTFQQFLEEQFQGVYNPPYGFNPNKELILDAWTNAGGTVTPEIDALYDQSRGTFMDRYPQLISDSVAVTDGAGTVASPEAGGPPMPPGMTGGPQLLGSGRDASTGMMPTVTGAASVPGAYRVTPAARPLPVWEEKLDPYSSFRRFRMEQFPGMSLQGLQNSSEALGYGYHPAYGRFFLNQLATGFPGAVAGVTPGAAGVTGAPGGMPQVPTSGAPVLDPATMAGVASGAITGDALGAGGYDPLGEGSLFREYLASGQRRPLGDIRGTYAGLSDWLRARSAYGSGSIGADITDLDPRFEIYLSDMAKNNPEKLAGKVIQMTAGALGARQGMGQYITPSLNAMYSTMSDLYGPDQALSRFADWAGSAYQRPSYTPYTPTRYQQGIGTQLAQIGSPYSVDPNALAADIKRQQADANSLMQYENMTMPSGVNQFAYNQPDRLPPTFTGLPGFN